LRCDAKHKKSCWFLRQTNMRFIITFGDGDESGSWSETLAIQCESRERLEQYITVSVEQQILDGGYAVAMFGDSYALSAFYDYKRKIVIMPNIEELDAWFNENVQVIK
jgi:hypothetical protein